MINKTHYVGIHHIKDDILALNLENATKTYNGLTIIELMEKRFSNYIFIFKDKQKVIDNFTMIWKANIFMLKKYDKVKEEAIALLLDKKNYQENTEEDRKLKNIEDPYARTTNVKDKNINIQSDDNSDLKIKLDTEEQKIQLEGVIGNELSLDNISSETTEELKKLKQLRNEGTITYIKSNVAIDLKKMLTYEFLDLPIQFIKQFDVLYNFNINVDWNLNELLLSETEYKDTILDKIITHLQGNSEDGVKVKRNNDQIIISHNYLNNKTLIARILQIEEVARDKATIAQLNAEIEKIPKIDSYTKKETEARITPLNARIDDIMKLFPHNINYYSDLSHYGINDSFFSAYGGNNDELRIFDKMIAFTKNNNLTHNFNIIEVQLNNHSNFSIYLKKMLEDPNNIFIASGLTSEDNIRILHSYSRSFDSDVFEIIYSKNKNWVYPFWANEKFRNVWGKWRSRGEVFNNRIIKQADRKLAIDQYDNYHEDEQFKTFKDKFDEPINIKTKKGVDFDGNIKKFHLILYEEINHHTVRLYLKQNATQILISSIGNTNFVVRPANKANTWNRADGLLYVKKHITAVNQKRILWDNTAKKATVPAGIYDLYFRHILYDSRDIVPNERGARLNILKADGTTPAVLGEDYIVGNKFIGDIAYYEKPKENQTKTFILGGVIQPIQQIIIVPQLFWPDTLARNSGLAHKQPITSKTHQNIFTLTRIDSGVELENIGNASKR